MARKLDNAATSMFWGGRMTGYLVLFWYLSLRNAYRYSEPSVWGGSFIDEVRLLTAMKQYLKQIKRHFPQLDSCSFQLAQVLHVTTERWREHKRCANALLHVSGGSRKPREFIFPMSTDRHFRFLISFFPTSLPHCSTVDKDWCATLCKEPTWGGLHQRERNSFGLQRLIVLACPHTCSGFTGRLVNPSQDFKRSTESFTCTFTHPFTPCRQPAAQVQRQ